MRGRAGGRRGGARGARDHTNTCHITQLRLSGLLLDVAVDPQTHKLSDTRRTQEGKGWLYAPEQRDAKAFAPSRTSP